MLKELGFTKVSKQSKEERLKRLRDIATVGAVSAVSRTFVPGPWEAGVAFKRAPKAKKTRAAAETTLWSTVGALPAAASLARDVKYPKVRDIPKKVKKFMGSKNRRKKVLKTVRKLKGPVGKAALIAGIGGALGGMFGYSRATR